MDYRSLVLSFILISSCSAAWANDDEMQTELKPGSTSTLPAESTAKTAPSAKPPSLADFKMRALVRKKAPFWIDHKKHGAAIRINKDGTFSSEAQGGGSIAGSWKIVNGQLSINWADGIEKYAYAIKSGKGGSLTINGSSPTKNRYNLN